MKKFISGIAFVLLTFVSVTAQTSAPKEVYKAENEGWLVKVDEAYALSKKTGKPIMANFTGSDWCHWCKKLTKDVFSKPEFKKWAEKNVVLLELDFPRRFRLPQDIAYQNNSLRQAFRVSGYPTIWVFNLDKQKESGSFNIEALAKSSYKPTVKAFVSDVENQVKGK